MYRINRSYDIPAQMELPKSMYSVRPVNGQTAGLYSSVNGNSEVTTRKGTLSESNRNSVKDSPKPNSPLDSKSVGKRKRSGSKSPPRNKSPVVKRELHKVGGSKMTNENVNNSFDDAARDAIIGKLEARQKVVIDKLLHLRDILNNLGATAVTASSGGSSAKSEVTSSVEVVVNADPANPPLSVVFLTKLLRDTYGSAAVSLQSYRHSSCQNSLTVNSNLFNKPLDADSKASKTIKVSVIWKRVEDGEPELIVQPSVQAPVTGEANIARYLSRLLPSVYPIHYDTLSWDDIIRVDGALEKAASGVKNLNDLEQQLQNNQPFLCGEATIADFVTFSAVAAYLQKNRKGTEKHPRVAQWLGSCQNLGGFRL
ncbi:unnamed protein product [Allacma fusca]|uniref:AIMP2 thioredoxin-like domain-containing protein n=1 Tax=Allacma fusca TaxID=39272 RepID=A0A8J2JYM9_9HEXA|nr:unnamed protein product [Allacma fusca]